MKPVIIFRHAEIEGPGFLGTVLDEHAIPWQVIKIDEGEPVPNSIAGFGGMVLMGGPMSVNDDLPWLARVLNLIREALRLDIPMLGHCLGGQLMSKALGAEITANPTKEIGWGEVAVSNNAQAKEWFGDLARFQVFHWHGETFSLPAGATHLLASSHCHNQAYSMGKHLALQCHIEMTADMVKSWSEAGAEEIKDAATSPAVQQPAEMLTDIEARVAALHAVARPVYEKWIASLAR